MTDQPATVAVIGAGGKMGMRVSNNLAKTDHRVLYVRELADGRERTPRRAAS